MTEPNAGSDASGVETRAVYDPDRKTYDDINGKKQWMTNGSIAKVLTVMAQTEVDTPKGKQDKITAFLVTPEMPGFKVTKSSLEKIGMRGSKTANLEFRNLEVPADNILGPIGGGLKVCLTVLDYGRTTFGATCTGAAKYLLAGPSIMLKIAINLNALCILCACKEENRQRCPRWYMPWRRDLFDSGLGG